MTEEAKAVPTPSCSGNLLGWTVEARYTGPQPRQLDPMNCIGKEWQKVQFNQDSPIGIPITNNPYTGDSYLLQFGLMNYQAAQALRWWFLANLEATQKYSGFGVETRLVKHRVTYSAQAARVGELDSTPHSWKETEDA